MHWWCSKHERFATDEDWRMLKTWYPSSKPMRFPPACPVCNEDGGLGASDIEEGCCAVPERALGVPRPIIWGPRCTAVRWSCARCGAKLEHRDQHCPCEEEA